MPQAIKDKFAQAVAKVMNDPAMRERLAKLDITPDVIPAAGAAHQAAKRDQELDAVHRRQGHQGGVILHNGDVPQIAAAAAYRRQGPLVVE